MHFLRRTDLRIGAIVWTVYFFYAVPGGDNPNTRLALVSSIVEEGRFEIDSYHDTSYRTTDKAFYRGHYYSLGPPGPAFLAVPAYLAFKGMYGGVSNFVSKMTGWNPSESLRSRYRTREGEAFKEEGTVEELLARTFIVAAVLGLTSAVLVVILYQWLGYFVADHKERLLITFSYAFGTIVFHYSTNYFSHIFSAFCLVVGFYLLFKTKWEGVRRDYLFLAGLAAGGVALMEYKVTILSPLCLLYLLTFLRDKNVGYFLMGGMAPILVLLVYHYVCFDDPLTPAYAYAFNAPEHQVGFFGLTYPYIAAIWGLSLSPYRGLFFYMPILIVSVYGLVCGLTERSGRYFPELVFIAVITVSYFLVISSFQNWAGGQPFGPRYLLPIIPFLMLTLSYGMRKIGYRTCLVISTISIFINWVGAQYGSGNGIGEMKNPLFQGLLPLLWEQGASSRLTRAMARSLHLTDQTAVFFSLALTVMLVAVIVVIWKVELVLPRRRASRDRP